MNATIGQDGTGANGSAVKTMTNDSKLTSGANKNNEDIMSSHKRVNTLLSGRVKAQKPFNIKSDEDNNAIHVYHKKQQKKINPEMIKQYGNSMYGTYVGSY